MTRKSIWKLLAISVALVLVTSAGVVSIAVMEEPDAKVEIDDDTCVGYEVYVDDKYVWTEDGDGWTRVTVSPGTHKFTLRKSGCTVSTTINCESGHNYIWDSMPDHWCDAYVIIDDDTCVGYKVYVDGVYQFTEGQDGTPDGYCAFYVSPGTHKFELRKNGCTTSKSWYCQCGTVYRWVSMPDHWCDAYVIIDDDTCVGYQVYVDDEYVWTEDGDGWTRVTVSPGTHKFTLRKSGCTVSTTIYCECGRDYTWDSMPNYWCWEPPVKPHKMSSKLAALIPPLGVVWAQPKTVVANIYLKPGTKTGDIETLEERTIEIIYRKENLIVAEIDTSEIEAIAALPFVSYLSTPLKAQNFPVDEVDKNVQCSNTNKQHNFSTGKGVKVAILDSYFLGYKELLGKELPENVTVMSFQRNKDLNGSESDPYSSRHGTACAEIVYSVAPDAELYLVSYDGDDYQLEKDVLPYLISEGVDVVSHSAGLTAGLFNGTDDTCKIIDDAVFNHNITWVNSAGNQARRHWEGPGGPFTYNEDGWGYHEYPDGGVLGQVFRAREGDLVVLSLSWNDTWLSATQDYELCVYNSSYEKVVCSADPQDGSSGNIPCENIDFIAPYKDDFYIVICHPPLNATKPVHFELYSLSHDLSCPVLNSSLCVEATAFGSIAAGAVSSDDSSILEPYSSRGPTNDGRIKPDFVGPTCVYTHAYASRFSGTSASAPYVAGALALQLSQPPYDLKPLLDHLENTTQKNNQFGYGLPNFGS